MLGVLMALALAAPGEPEPTQLRVSLRGVAEQWQDRGIGSVYRAGAPIGAVAIGLPIVDRLWLDVEVGYRRLNSADDEALSLHLVPAAVLAEWSLSRGAATPFVALGPTLTAYTETFAPDSDGVASTSGARLAGELRLGFRVNTGLIEPRRAPAPNPVKAVHLELYVGRRQARPIGGRNGFDMGAWRAALGLSLAL